MRRSFLFPSRFQTIPQITTQALPSANQNQPYSFQLTETGGTYPFVWSAVITPNTGGAFSINSATGVLSGTQSIVETETVAVTVTDSMTPHNTAKASFFLSVNSGVVITTSSLPSGTVGVPYSATLAATGGTAPYTWSMSPSSIDGLTLNSSNGVLSGTPTSATTVTGTFTATDSLGIPSAPVSLSLTVIASGSVQPPQAVFRGFIQSQSLMVSWWGPTAGPWPDSFNVYRNSGTGPTKINPNPVVGVQFSSGAGAAFTPQFFYIDDTTLPSTTYTYTVTCVAGGVESPQSAPLSLTTLAGSATAATPPAAPTKWTPDAFSVPTGGTTWNVNTSSGLISALASAQRGDVISIAPVSLDAGGAYTPPPSGFVIPVFPGASPNYVYIISANYANLPPSGTRVSPADAANMPTLLSIFSVGTCFTMTQQASHVRFVGLNVSPLRGSLGSPPGALWQFSGVGQATFQPCDHIIVDRCLFGNDSTTAGFAEVTHGLTATFCNYFALLDSYAYGFYGGGGPDAYPVGIVGGGPGVINNNYLEGVTQSILFGGTGTAAPGMMPHDWTITNNYCFKQPAWGVPWTARIDNGTPGVAGNIMTVTAIQTAGATPVVPGHAINGTGVRFTPTTFIVNQLTGTTGGVGTYTVSGAAQAAASTTMSSQLDSEIKNHFEMKSGTRVEFANNTCVNCNDGGGQHGISFLMGTREGSFATYSVSARIDNGTPGVAGNILTINTVPPPPFWPVGITRGAAIASDAGGFVPANTFITGQLTGTGGGGTYTISGPPLSVATETMTIGPDSPNGQDYWVYISDVDVHDNNTQGIGIGAEVFTADTQANSFVERVRFQNNRFWHSPVGTQFSQLKTQVDGIQIQGPCPDIIINNNTCIMDTANPLVANPGSTSGILITQRNWRGTLGPTSPGLLIDRCVVTNNILDGVFAISGTDGTGAGISPTGNATLVKIFANAVWNNNVAVSDTHSYDGTFASANTNVGGNYASLGMANFVNKSTAPANLTAWNVVSGTYATASTTGGPVGATLGTLAQDPFPRTIWQVIQPNNAVMAAAAFATNASKYNVICCGPYLGTPSTTNIETDMGTTFPTIFANIKAKSSVQGFSAPTRCLHYIDATAQNTTGGSSGPADPTFVQWTNAVNTTNWWIRTSYPAGTIVPATNFGDAAGSGLTAVTSQNSILDGTGLTFSQQFARQYDLALRTGQGTTLGYGAGKALVANSLLDGYQFDNHVSSVRSTGAWGMDTTSYTSNWSSSGNPTADAFVQDGEAAQVAAMRAQFPGVIIWGNSDYFVHANGNFSYSVTLRPSQQGLYDIVFLQSCIGAPGGIEGQGTTTTAQFMANYTAAFAQAAPGGTVMFEQTGRSHAVGWTTVAQSGWGATDWQAARFGLACCVMQNGYYALNSQQNYNPNAPYFMDETLTQNGRFGWLGQPIDGPQSASRTNGVWWRQFQNGVVFMNPAGNGVQTLTLASLGLSGFSAIAQASPTTYGDASVNTGAPVTSITLQARDGRFLIKKF